MSEFPIVTVGGLILAPDGTFLLVKAPKWGNLWTIPGGKVHLGETMEEAFIREMREETGLERTKPEHLFFQESIFSNQYHQKRHFIFHEFFAHLAKGFSKEDVKLNDEATDFQWVAPKVALEMPIPVSLRKVLEHYLRRDEVKMGLFMVLPMSLGTLPEEEKAGQEILIDVETVPNFGERLNEYQFRELVQNLASKGIENIDNFAEELANRLKKELPIHSLVVTVRKPHSTIGISTYATVKR